MAMSPLHHGHVTVTSLLHHGYITVTWLHHLHHGYITVTSWLHHCYITTQLVYSSGSGGSKSEEVSYEKQSVL